MECRKRVNLPRVEFKPSGYEFRVVDLGCNSINIYNQHRQWMVTYVVLRLGMRRVLLSYDNVLQTMPHLQ